MSPEGCHHLVTHSGNNRLRLAMATNHHGYEDPWDACINAGWFPPFLPSWVSLRGAVHRHSQRRSLKGAAEGGGGGGQGGALREGAESGKGEGRGRALRGGAGMRGWVGGGGARRAAKRRGLVVPLRAPPSRWLLLWLMTGTQASAAHPELGPTRPHVGPAPFLFQALCLPITCVRSDDNWNVDHGSRGHAPCAARELGCFGPVYLDTAAVPQPLLLFDQTW